MQFLIWGIYKINIFLKENFLYEVYLNLIDFYKEIFFLIEIMFKIIIFLKGNIVN